MLPLHDDNPTTIRPVVTIGLIILCLAVFVYQSGLPPRAARAFVLMFGAIPADLFHGLGIPRPFDLPAWITLFTSMTLHGGWQHLLGNMLFLWVFGNNVEDALGHLRFLAFYAVCGLIAALTHALIDVSSTVPMVGASGAISGVMGAYILLHPRARVLVWAVALPLRLPAVVLLGLWFLMQLVSAFGAADQGVAFWAHIGGFIAGMALLVPFRRRGVALFQPPRVALPPKRRRSRLPPSGSPPPKPPRRGPWG
ncbi:rhomboid family intramembrane serine protease [Rhodospirillum rubrum]|uniref:rhomboid family intramembrane serine protease n=1 Tax=Rhodospirillum rubrum TaxID=1085 RepID=UPI00190463CF|nr:rhomboid family intramembrane serine protease [Rhodospirillum rubrum]MBK1664228.1 rhomboid family intramembrane serine protease [Rhodospirillum rubrum]MBK1676454.1 rhomboid family intramembrane serine protease [Rhodospirillum rubrum]